MQPNGITITMVFSPEDLADIRARGLTPPKFWDGHLIPPNLHDVIRFGGRQYVVNARVWEHRGQTPELVLYLSDGKTQSNAH